jgi:hypothetical protein
VLNVHGVHNVRQKDIQMPEPLVPEPSLVEVEIVIGKLISWLMWTIHVRSSNILRILITMEI